METITPTTCRLKELCEKEGITLYKLAQELGRRPNTISRIANGERFPRRDLRRALCRRFRCELVTIFPDEKYS